MPNDEFTPVTSVLELLRGQVAAHHDRINRLDSFRIETVGDSGAAGRLRTLEVTVEKLDEHLDEQRRTLNSLDKRTEGLVIKLGAIIAVMTTAATLAVKLLIGG